MFKRVKDTQIFGYRWMDVDGYYMLGFSMICIFISILYHVTINLDS